MSKISKSTQYNKELLAKDAAQGAPEEWAIPASRVTPVTG